MYEVFDHTADLGVRVRAPTRDGLVAEAGRALTALILADPSTLRARTERVLHVEAPTAEDQLRDFLAELLYLFESERFLGTEFEVRSSTTGLDARVRGDIIDPAREVMEHEVKAVTYHGLQVTETADGWVGEVILDI